ncbi:MAG TPA: hypothetical protein VM925_37870, partial [Labilithrix sp.]|nr:hypothetical protein [Labilithrix sp.]
MRAQFLRASSIVTLGIVATSGCSLIVATDGLTGGRDGETTAEPEPPDGNVVVSDAGPEASQDASPSPRFCAG